VAVAPAAPPPLETLFPAAADESLAWRQLATRWGVTLGYGDPCSAAEREGLQCWRSRGGLGPVRQLDRPGVLRLTDERGRSAHAVLLALDGEMATLALGGSERTLTLAELARWWRGDYATFWRAPPGWQDGEVPTAWLQQQLARAAPAAAGTLRERVSAFQLTQGLVPDGVAGPLTLMQLNRAAGIGEPRLATSGSRPS
jgi:general secretion pathway protein A